MKKAYDRICAMLATSALLMIFISSNLFGQSEIDNKLFQAVFEGDTLRAGELLSQGANPNSEFEGQTLLFHAIKNDDLEMLELLVSKGSDVNKRSKERLSPLEFSLQVLENGGREDPEVAVFLINNGANLKTKGKNTLLHRAADNGYPASIAKALIENGADIDAKDKLKMTPLFYAMLYDSEEVALVISRYGPSLDFTLEIEEYVAPLTYALLELNSDELVESFVRHGADFNHRDEGYLSPFELAVERGFYRSVGAMLQNGADPDRLIEELPLLIYVLETEEIDTYDDTLLYSLIDQGANVNVEYEGKSLASHLINEYVNYKLDSVVFWNCNSEELEMATLNLLLLKAVRENDVKTVQRTISEGAEVNPGIESDLPLHLALWGGSIEVVDILVKAGADVNGRDYSGDTPLHEICDAISELGRGDDEYIPPHYLPKVDPEELRHFPEKSCRLLVAHGADVNAKDSYGNTPLMMVKKRFPQFAELLIELGAVEEP